MKFNPVTDIPDLSGKIVLVTGGSDGLGKESVRQLAQHNPSKIYLAARNQSKTQGAIDEIRSTFLAPRTCPPIIFLDMDLSSLKSVRTAAEQYLAQETRLDILICNAGVLTARGLTPDGYEVVFGTNHIGHSLLILLLLPLLLSTAQLSGVKEGDTRCVVVSSIGESMAPKNAYLFDKIRTDLSDFSLWARYGQSKLANIHTVIALALKYPEEDSRVRFLAVHPGQVKTNMGNLLIPNKFLRYIFSLIMPLFMRVSTVEEGVKNQLWAATAPSFSDIKAQTDEGSISSTSRSGAFYLPVGVESKKASQRAGDIDIATTLWEWTENELQSWIRTPTQ